MIIFARATVAGIAFGLAMCASQAFAATTIKVVEAGEEGQAMSIKLDPATVKAGPASFAVHNDAAVEEHEMILVRLTSPGQKVEVAASKHRVDENALQSLGEVSDLKPGADGLLKADLSAGTYLVFCNIEGHYEAGMKAELTVTP